MSVTLSSAQVLTVIREPLRPFVTYADKSTFLDLGPRDSRDPQASHLKEAGADGQAGEESLFPHAQVRHPRRSDARLSLLSSGGLRCRARGTVLPVIRCVARAMFRTVRDTRAVRAAAKKPSRAVAAILKGAAQYLLAG